MRYFIGMTPLFVLTAVVGISAGVHGWQSWAYPALLSAAFLVGVWAGDKPQ